MTALPSSLTAFGDYSIDYVRGRLRETAEPLPRIPPLRVRGGLRYQRNALNLGGEITGGAAQERVCGSETPTAGYGLLRLYGSYSFPIGAGAVSTITARLDNATDTVYRNHLSYVEDLVPEMGRTFKLSYGVTF